MRASFLLPFMCVLGTLRTVTQAQQTPQLVYANFVLHEFHSLNVSNITASRLVRNEVDCFFACIRTSPCVSINLAASPDMNEKLKCDLIATDKYSSPEKFRKSSQVHHYSKYCDCDKKPWLNNGTCLPIYNEKDYKCKCPKGFVGRRCEVKTSARTSGLGTSHALFLSSEVTKNCADVYADGFKKNGVYKIHPDGLGGFDVYCDHVTDGGGWTVFQKRFNGSVDFYRGWDEYKKGFGDLNGEFWLGLDKIYRLTNQTQNKLRVDLQGEANNTAYAEYVLFTIGNEASKYNLSLEGYSGTTGDSFTEKHNHMPFTTKDRDNDFKPGRNCATDWKGGWWYYRCLNANLNGLYQPGHRGRDGMSWKAWKEGTYIGLKGSQMKVRPNSL